MPIIVSKVVCGQNHCLVIGRYDVCGAYKHAFYSILLHSVFCTHSRFLCKDVPGLMVPKGLRKVDSSDLYQ